MDVTSLPACELARALRGGRLAAREVVAAFLDRIEATNPARSEEHTSELQ